MTRYLICGSLLLFCSCEFLRAFLGGAAGEPDGGGLGRAAGQLAAQAFPWLETVAGCLVGILGDRGQQKIRAVVRNRRADKANPAPPAQPPPPSP